MAFSLKNIYEWPVSRRLLVLVLFFVIIFYLGYRWDLLGLRVDIATSRQQEKDLKHQLEMSVSRELRLQHDLIRFTKIKLLLTEWQKKLIHLPDLPELLNEILKTGANNQLYFTMFNPGDEINKGDYSKTPIKVVVVGNYHQIGDFLSQLANMASIVVISNFTISNENKTEVLGTKLAEQANATNLLTAEITLEIYRQAEKKPKTEKKATGGPVKAGGQTTNPANAPNKTEIP